MDRLGELAKLSAIFKSFLLNRLSPKLTIPNSLSAHNERRPHVFMDELSLLTNKSQFTIKADGANRWGVLPFNIILADKNPTPVVYS